MQSHRSISSLSVVFEYQHNSEGKTRAHLPGWKEWNKEWMSKTYCWNFCASRAAAEEVAGAEVVWSGFWAWCHSCCCLGMVVPLALGETEKKCPVAGEAWLWQHPLIVGVYVSVYEGCEQLPLHVWRWSTKVVRLDVPLSPVTIHGSENINQPSRHERPEDWYWVRLLSLTPAPSSQLLIQR